MQYKLAEDGKTPIPVADMVEWAKAFGDIARKVAEVHYKRGKRRYYIITVFLGLDYSFSDGPPVLWETMIFGHSRTITYELGGRSRKYHPDVYMNRYSSYEDALEGHRKALEWARKQGGK
jgi:hypothetical protein